MNRKLTYTTLIFTLLMLLGPTAVAAQQVFSAHVVDAESREPLPFVKVYSRTANGVLTNYEGQFHISTIPSDTLVISLVGYAPQRIIAANLPKTIRMSVRSQQLKEVTVTPIQPFLVRASKQLAKEFKKHKDQTSTFFLRMRQDYFLDSVTWAGLKRQMIEAFISGQSAINLRNPQVITGFRSGFAPEGLHGNAYQLMQVGAMVLGEGLYLTRKDVVTPLHPKASVDYYNKYYVIKEKSVRGEHGQNLRRITFQTYADVICPIIVGTLLIDYDTMQPLSFDGHVMNIMELVHVDEYQASEVACPHFHVNYKHDRGFTEVASLFVQDRLSKKASRSTLVNMGQMAMPQGIQITGDNLFASIDSAGFDRDFWTEHETVMRTDDEEYLFRHSENNPTNVHLADSQHTERRIAEAELRYLAELRRRDSIAMKRIQGMAVVEAGTKRPLPFTDVTVLGRSHTVTNLNGLFRIDFGPTDTLLFQCNGYEPLKVAGKYMRYMVQLKPFRVVDKKSDIKIKDVLTRIGTQMQDQLEAHRTDSATYHYRRIRTLLNDSVLTEAFVKAPCVVKLDEPKVLLARNYYVEQPTVLDSLGEVNVGMSMQGNFDILKDKFPDVSEDQLSKLAQVLPKTVQRSWDQMEQHKRDFNRPYVPLLGVDKKKHYQTGYESEDDDHIPFAILEMIKDVRDPSQLVLLEDECGNHYCRISLKRRLAFGRNEYGGIWFHTQDYPATIGNLLIDLDNMRLLSFEGRIENVETDPVTMRDFALKVRYLPHISIRYDFVYDHGYPEIWHYANHINARLSGHTDMLTSDWCCLFNTRGMNIGFTDESLEHSTLRLEAERRMAQHEPQAITDLFPRFICFDIFNETGKVRLMRW